ncbi:hypothetical protein GCM10012278_08160 [Nonomuraea glycinis]|uniref:Uncharacterized protein n=1 Tax=Nonomuraea glycinis TaxID=2047744 RepID=A0A917ZZN1_9ACTN|nr:hypothetical protein GCM10012278_08160 [Nonomuraea glycinis]
MTFRQLRDVRPEMREGTEDEYGEWKIDWRLWIGKDGLVRRAWSKWRQPEGEELKGAAYGQGCEAPLRSICGPSTVRCRVALG